MRVSSPYRFTAVISSAEGAPLGEVPIDVNWSQATQCAGFTGARRGLLPALLRYRGDVEVMPEWDSAPGEPFVKGFNLHVEGSAFVECVPRTYAYRSVQVATAPLVAQGKLKDGELFVYKICAYATDHGGVESHAVVRRGRSLAKVEQPIQIQEHHLAQFVDSSTPCCAEEVDSDFPVFLNTRVLVESQQLARNAGDKERAGFLLGHVHRDAGGIELFLEVTALIEAKGIESSHAQVTFTPETWEAARMAVALRRESELIVGWVHNHPWFCAKCGDAQRAQCVFRNPFFSEQDRGVHGASFTGAFQVALLVTDLGQPDLICSLFGWRHGNVVQRHYFALAEQSGHESESSERRRRTSEMTSVN